MNINQARELIFNYVDNNQSYFIDFLSQYIQHNSVNIDLDSTGKANECQKWLADKLAEMSTFQKIDYWLENERFSNLVATLKGDNSGRNILFAAHTDTVPITDDQLKVWRKDAGPLSGALIENKIWGRGASDMKGGGAASVLAAYVLARCGIKLKGDAYFSFVTSEETGNRKNGVDAIVDRGYKSDVCLVTEPTNMTITPAVNGEFYFRLKIKGHSAHIASRHLSIYPQKKYNASKGVNAIEEMMKIINAFQETEHQLGLYKNHPLGDPGSTTINVSEISGGGIFSSMAETCEIIGSMLYSPIISQDQAMEEFRNTIKRVVEGDYWLRNNPPELELPYFLPSKPPINTDINHPLCKAIESSLISENTFKPNYAVMISTTDGNYFQDRGIEVITFGPGSISMGTHSYNEYIPVDQFISSIKVYAMTILQWCGLN